MAGYHTDEIEHLELEQSGLQSAISSAETALAVSAPDVRGILEKFLQGAKIRVSELDKKIKTAQTEKESHAKEQAARVQMAQSESALNRQEKETYSGFLKKDFFTKNDFSSLEKFYAKTWDRLSEKGKNEMTARVWEGVRKGEYEFEELPASIREKTTEQTYKRLHEVGGDFTELPIPATDRNDFIRAYEGGKKNEAEKVLSRDGFKQNVFHHGDQASRSPGGAEAGRESEASAVAARMSAKTVSATPVSSKPGAANRADIDLTSVKLDGLRLMDSNTPPSSKDLPTGKAANLAAAPSRSS